MTKPLPHGSTTRSSADVSDQTLILAIVAQDERALEALYDRYGGLTFTLASRIVGDPALAEEIMQDTLLRCWMGAERYHPSRGSVAGWLMGIARNRAIDVLRGGQHQARLRERNVIPEDDDRRAGSQSDSSQETVDHLAVTEALAKIPAAQRQVLELAFYSGLTQSEIADRTGAPLGTVKSRIRDGMERLRVLLPQCDLTQPESRSRSR